jgi:hypothetical protein
MSTYQIAYKKTNNQVVYKTSNNFSVYKQKLNFIETSCPNPRVMLQWSDDGGYTWSNEYWVHAGKAGEFKSRIQFNRLGMSRDRVFRMTVSDPVKWIVVDARMDVEKEK